MGAHERSQDRIMRLLHVLAVFQARPRGLTTRQLAERLEVSQRTAQRDLLHLQAELHVPLVQIGSRWMVASDFWLAPIVFSIHEAMAILLSARLMLRFADKANPFAASAYEKVAAALPEPVKAPVLETADLLSMRPLDQVFLEVLIALTGAWAERRKVIISYSMPDTFDREVWPLFVEPNPSGHSSYLVAWDPKRQAVRSYKMERISAVRVLHERFDPPLGFSIGKHLAHAWGIWTSQKPVQVELRFSPEAARRVKETTWHQSQESWNLPDGGIGVRLLVAEPTELKHWILGWGSTCEVVAPKSFRDDLAHEALGMADLYGTSPAAMVGRRRAG